LVLRIRIAFKPAKFRAHSVFILQPPAKNMVWVRCYACFATQEKERKNSSKRKKINMTLQEKIKNKYPFLSDDCVKWITDDLRIVDPEVRKERVAVLLRMDRPMTLGHAKLVAADIIEIAKEEILAERP